MPAPTHLQAIKPTVTPFRDIGLRKSSRITDEDETTADAANNPHPEAKLDALKLDPDYFDAKSKEEEEINRIIENEGGLKDYPLDEFYKKVKEIKQKIKLEEQYIPSLDNIETAFYELIDTEKEIRHELELHQKEEAKI